MKACDETSPILENLPKCMTLEHITKYMANKYYDTPTNYPFHYKLIGCFRLLSYKCCLRRVVLRWQHYKITNGLSGGNAKYDPILPFLAATKQLYEWYFLSVCPSVRLSVRLSHLFDYVPIIVSS